MPERHFMQTAIQEAQACVRFGDHPVGAVIVKDKVIISQAGDRTHRNTNPVHHAEIVAIELACKKLERKDLTDCVLYSTHKPCPMCAAACVHTRLAGVIFGTLIDASVHLTQNNPGVHWRTLPIRAAAIIQSCNDKANPFVLEGFMRRECLVLLHTLKNS